MEEMTVDQWRERILSAWEKWGTGKPLDPRTVESLAAEFSKPLQFPPQTFDWGKRNEPEFFLSRLRGTLLFGIPLKPDATIPDGEIHLQYPDGRVDKIVNIGKAK